MNCTQAQAMLAAYRELKNDAVETLELEMHLEQCAFCRQVLARYSFVGEQLRLLPAIEPPPEMHTKLMRALATEHSQFIQRSTFATPPTPEFLKPYLQEQHINDSFTALSMAETGPLPIIRTTPNRRPRSHMGQFSILGLTAMFLMALMMGGLTSLLLLAHGGPSPVAGGGGGELTIDQPTIVAKATYTTNTPYYHVVSAVADRANIYYTAYGDDANSGWMLEQLDRSTKLSNPLLDTTSRSPLIVLGASNGWLVWLQLDAPKPSVHRPQHETNSLVRTWSLHYLSLTSQQQGLAGPQTLLSGIFDQGTAPGWVHTPVQGIWFIQNTLLVAMIDNNGVSHLLSYQLDAARASSPIEIASTSSDHIFTSPTANNDGTRIYWSEEWLSNDGVLHSNIWTQQSLSTPDTLHWRIWGANHRLPTKQLFLANGMSFSPAVVDDNLFLLSIADLTNPTQATPGTTPSSTPGTTATGASTSVVSWADTSIYPPPPDASVRGMLLMFLAGDPTVSPSQMDTLGRISGLQAGASFLLWQSDNSYGMLDVTTGTPVTVTNALKGAHFLAVNGDTAVWTVNDATVGLSNSATLMAFNWPTK